MYVPKRLYEFPSLFFFGAAVRAGTIALIACCANPAFAQTSSASSCAVKITKPSDGASVELTGNAEGTVAILPGKYLWIFAKIGSYQNQDWYPQGQGSAVIRNGSWSVFVTYGIASDRGAFNVLAEIVDQAQDIALESWVANANSPTNTAHVYSPIALPPPATGCGEVGHVVDRVTVIRQ